MCKKFALALLFFSMIVGAAHAKKVYKLYGDAPMGSKFRPIEAKSAIPFNKQYDQLTQVQRDVYRLQFDDLSEDEIPPFPKYGTESIYKPLIKGHERISRGGWLRLIAAIDENGKVEEVSVYETPHKEITELALSVMFHAEFEPAMCSGEPCKMDYPFEFKLRKRVKQFNTLNSEDIPGFGGD
ncbi:MAG: hypothetical protein ACJARN_000665 [Arenicella sp.]|jgi:hypothetical protein